MDEKMMAAFSKLKSAMAELEACHSGGAPKSEKSSLPVSEMPDQEMDAEEGDYTGKGMMAGNSKMEVAKAAMKKKGY